MSIAVSNLEIVQHDRIMQNVTAEQLHADLPFILSLEMDCNLLSHDRRGRITFK
jgi:hypothetical protein